MTTHRVLVTGSRYWDDEKAVVEALVDQLILIPYAHHLVVVHGACPTGADAIAAAWAADHPRVINEPHPALWDRFGTSAGPLRNQEMVGYGAKVCLAFLLPGSKGTLDCVNRAKRAGIPVIAYGVKQLAS